MVIFGTLFLPLLFCTSTPIIPLAGKHRRSERARTRCWHSPSGLRVCEIGFARESIA